jgi:hypothetical protein
MDALQAILRELVERIDRLGRAAPGAQALALWQVAVLEVRDRLEASGARPRETLADLARAVDSLAREVRASELPDGLSRGPLLEALERLAAGLEARRKLAARAAPGENGPEPEPPGRR